MKILNLVIHNSHIEVYEKMYEVLSPFYKRLDFVETYFIEYDETLKCEYKFDEDVLRIRGKESMVPGVLHKTLDSLLILRQSLAKKYAWIIRSNVSTVINFHTLYNFLENNPTVEYFAGQVENLQWLHPPSGISDDKHFGTIYAQGTLIGFSNYLTNAILEKRHKFKFDIIDDVSVGLFIKENIPLIQCQKIDNGQVNAANQVYSFDTINNFNIQNNPVAWRNKSIDREIDIINMQTIVDVLNKANNVHA